MYFRGMAESTPREAAYQLLRRQSRHRPTNPSGLIDLDTVDFVAERCAPGRCVLGTTLRDMTGVDFCLLFFGLEESDGSWRAQNARMIAIDPPGPNIAFLFEFAAGPNTIDFVGVATGAATGIVASVSLTFRRRPNRRSTGRRRPGGFRRGWGSCLTSRHRLGRCCRKSPSDRLVH
jgi:hypothetical protein